MSNSIPAYKANHQYISYTMDSKKKDLANLKDISKFLTLAQITKNKHLFLLSKI